MTETEKTAGELVEIAAAAASSKKAQNIVIMDMQKVLPVTDYFLIASGTSVPQVQAIADAIEEKLAEAGLQFLHKEGYREARWVLLDYGVFVAHIFVNEERQFYNLEQLWGSAPARRRNRSPLRSLSDISSATRRFFSASPTCRTKAAAGVPERRE